MTEDVELTAGHDDAVGRNAILVKDAIAPPVADEHLGALRGFEVTVAAQSVDALVPVQILGRDALENGMLGDLEQRFVVLRREAAIGAAR